MPHTLFPRAQAATKARLETDPLIRMADHFDWGHTELGPIVGWPEALRAAARLLLASDVPMVLMAGRRDGVLIYNTGYALFAGDRHPSIFGRPALEAWPEIADFNRENMRRGFAGEAWYLSDQELVLNRTGQLESAWMNLNYSPVLDDAGEVLAVLVVVVETTEQHHADQALAESEARFRTLADTMPQMVWSTRPDGRVDYYNARWYEFTGANDGSSDGDNWQDLVHPEDRDRVGRLWREAVITGEPYRVEYRLRHRDGGYRWVLAQALPIRDTRGRIMRWFGTCTDIHEGRLVAEEREVVAQELSHRIKNIFALVGGLVGVAARQHPEASGFADGLRQRIVALGRAHDLVRPNRNAAATGNPATLQALVSELLAPYLDGDDDRLRFSGDQIAIGEAVATPLALLFHELATNAAKYGALSAPEGRLHVDTALDDDSVRVSWREQGGKAVGEERGQGFGSRLMSLSVEGQLQGSLDRRWHPDGLCVEIVLPRERLGA